MNAQKAIRLARKHLGGEMEGSARLALEDAVILFDQGDMEHAKARAVRSLQYSIGIFHPDYQKAQA